MASTRAVAQMAMNIQAVLRHYALPEIVVLTTQTDRLTAVVAEGFEAALELAQFRAWPFNANHGTTARASWREPCCTYSLQAVAHTTGVWEFDVDYVNPHPSEGLACTVGHVFEVVWNRLRRRKTDPFRVRRALVKRGIDVAEAT